MRTYDERLKDYAEEYIKELLETLQEVYERKNADYGNAASDTYLKYGPVAYVVRLEDKFSRARTLFEQNFDSQVEESIVDTFCDSINYLIMFTADLLGITYIQAREKIIDKTNLFTFAKNDDPLNPFNKDMTDDFFGTLSSVNTEVSRTTLYSGDNLEKTISIRKMEYQTENKLNNVLFINGLLIRVCLRELAHLHATERIYLEDEERDMEEEK